MNNRDLKIILEDDQSEFFYKENKLKLNISFNRVSFIFFIFFMIFVIYSIHLIHLGSRNSKIEFNDNLISNSNNLYRADIVDRNGKYLGKQVSSIDIGISTQKFIDKKKLLVTLQYIFTNKNYQKIETQLEHKNFFYFD